MAEGCWVEHLGYGVGGVRRNRHANHAAARADHRARCTATYRDHTATRCYTDAPAGAAHGRAHPCARRHAYTAAAAAAQRKGWGCSQKH
jgi:hypothetical protein